MARASRRRLLTALLAAPLLACGQEPPPNEPMAPGQHTVSVHSFDPAREIEAIKAIRAETGLGLAKAKELIDSLDAAAARLDLDLTAETAEALKTRLARAGIDARITSHAPPESDR